MLSRFKCKLSVFRQLLCSLCPNVVLLWAYHVTDPDLLVSFQFQNQVWFSCSSGFRRLSSRSHTSFALSFSSTVPLSHRCSYQMASWPTNSCCFAQATARIIRARLCQRDFKEESFQQSAPHQTQMSMEWSELINQEVEAILTKASIHLVYPRGIHFLSNLFLVPKEEGGTGQLSIWRH